MESAHDRHRAAGVLLVAYSLFLVFVLFNPSNDVPSSSISRLSELGTWLHLPGALVRPDRVEFATNVLIVMPVPFIGSLLRPQLGWRDWTAFGFLASGLVELWQGLFLADRSATYSDVVANTGGALAGALAFAVVMRVLASRRARAQQA